MVPTILELAGAEASKKGQLVPPAPGKSLVPVFAENNTIEREYLWWSHDGNRAVRVQDWKLVAAKDKPWELFDLAKDRAETRDLATQFPLKVKKLEKLWLTKENEFIETATGKGIPEKKK